MADSEPAGGRSRAARTAWTGARWLLGLALGAGAMSFLVHGRAAFARLRQPDEARILLAGAELAGAVLFLFRRTLLAGALVLLIVLAWAAGLHFALGLASLRLWLYLAAVLALLWLSPAKRTKPGATGRT